MQHKGREQDPCGQPAQQHQANQGHRQGHQRFNGRKAGSYQAQGCAQQA